MLAGRPHEAVSNGSPRWMAAGPRLTRVPRTRPTGRLARRLTEDGGCAVGWPEGAISAATAAALAWALASAALARRRSRRDRLPPAG